ncbi:MAG: DUF4419 domain-containing protein [Bacteroidales bacterium]|nr:DUF4419 domain-containing protein [Bacteroidales bacterium]
MKKLLILVLTIFIETAYAQEGVTFKVEKLTPPDTLLPTEQILEMSFISGEKIVAQSEFPQYMVRYCDNFFYTVLTCYLDHRPLVLSPDMIWLLIEQGFANHVNAHHEKLRSKFVDFDGKKTLTVFVGGKDSLTMCEQMLDLKWDSIIQQFPLQIAEYTGKELINTLTADFSTTGATEKVVSEVTIMKAMEKYFEYKVVLIGCGIPEITLLGTTEDWEKVLEKTKALEKYDLKWWIDDLEPILEQFVLASQNQIDTDFWKKMFKYHEGKAYKKSPSFDGWLVHFYPYNDEGQRNSKKKIYTNNVPTEVQSVSVKYSDDIHHYETTLQLDAGFFGCEQNSSTFALKPTIGWILKMPHEHNRIEPSTIKESIPDELRLYKSLYWLEINYTEGMTFPSWMKNIYIEGGIIIYGPIPEKELSILQSYYPHTPIKVKGNDD